MTQCRRPSFDPWIRKIFWRRECQPTPVFLPGESRGQRSLMGCSPWRHKESDTTEWLTNTFNSFPEFHILIYSHLSGTPTSTPHQDQKYNRPETKPHISHWSSPKSAPLSSLSVISAAKCQNSFLRTSPH